MSPSSSDGYLTRLLSRDDFWALAATIDGRTVGGLTRPLTALWSRTHRFL
jgi:hypothetical protein